MASQSQLKAGQKAPDFEIKDTSGKLIRLSDFSDKNVLICFFRYAGCPWCNLAIHQLIIDYPLYEDKNFQIIAFVQSSSSSIEEYIVDRHTPKPPFPIIADPERIIYDLYGVSDSKLKSLKSLTGVPAALKAGNLGFKQGKVDGSVWLVPAHFMVSIGGNIYKADYGTSYYDPMSRLDITDFASFGGE